METELEGKHRKRGLFGIFYSNSGRDDGTETVAVKVGTTG